jgi:hypothetical protein
MIFLLVLYFGPHQVRLMVSSLVAYLFNLGDQNVLFSPKYKFLFIILGFLILDCF